MNQSKHQVSKLNIVGFIACLFVVLVTIVPIFYFTDSRFVESNGQILDNHWNIDVSYLETGEEEVFTDVVLSETSFPMVGKGDVITLTREFTGEVEISNPLLRIYSVHSMVEVYLDDELVYSYGQERAAEGRMLGYGYHYIPLTTGYSGSTLKIVYTTTEDDAYSGIPQISIDDSLTYLQESVSGDRVRLAGALLLIMFGSFAMVVSCFMILRSTRFRQLFCIATFSVLIGVWTLCNNDMIMYFTQNLLVKCYFEYLSIYSLPLPFLFYFSDRVSIPAEGGKSSFIFGRKHRGLKGKTIGHCAYWILTNAQVLFILVVCLTQALNLVHLPVWLHLAHVFMGVDILFVVVIFVESRRMGRPISKGVQWGMGIIFFFLLFELIRYNVDKYLFSFTGNAYNSTLCFGALIIVVALIVDFANQITEALYKEAQQNLLEEMAYTDKLTGLGNRRRCDDALTMIDQSENDYMIISIDLNLLKYYNDTFGHDMGDILLQKYAQVLQDTFDSNVVLCRNGGDEFMALITDLNHFNMKETRKIYDENMEEVNRKFKEEAKRKGREPMRLSSAYGEATRSELPKDADFHAVFRLADERMYACKRRMKEARKD